MKEFYHNMKIFSIIDELISDVGGEEDACDDSNQSHINSLRSMFKNKGIDESKVLIAYKVEKIEELTISQYKGIFNNQEEMKERYGV